MRVSVPTTVHANILTDKPQRGPNHEQDGIIISSKEMN